MAHFDRGVYEPGEDIRVFDGSEDDEDVEPDEVVPPEPELDRFIERIWILLLFGSVMLLIVLVLWILKVYPYTSIVRLSAVPLEVLRYDIARAIDSPV